MDTSDKIAVIVSILALLVALAAATYARRQALAAERANQLNSRPTWRLMPHTGTKYMLKNVTEHVQTGVLVDKSRITCHHMGTPDGTTVIPPGGSYTFTMTAMSGEALPKFVYVSWDAMHPTPSWWRFWRSRYEAVAVE